MQVDPRGIRFSAWLTTLVLAFSLTVGSAWLLFAQSLIFAVGAFSGLRWAPYGLIYQYVIARHLKPHTKNEPAAPAQFAQGVGFAMTAIAVIAAFSGFTTVGLIAATLALAATFANAAFGFCLGCELYLLIRRFSPPTIQTEDGKPS